jgi:hypothetical protein
LPPRAADLVGAAMKNFHESPVIHVRELSNAEFIARHARGGCVGLAGGDSFIDRAIARAQRRLGDTGSWGKWSHAFFFQGVRADGQPWVIESDLQFHRKHIQLGVQENRASKYHDEKLYTRLAVLDFGLTAAQSETLVREGLELVATRTRYSIAELFGTLLALRSEKLRASRNVLARDHALFCSAMVREIFQKAGVDLTPGVAVKNTAPDDLARSPLVKTIFELDRPTTPTRLEKLDQKVFAMKSRLQAARAKLKS